MDAPDVWSLVSHVSINLSVSSESSNPPYSLFLLRTVFSSVVVYKRRRLWSSYRMTQFDVRDLKFSQLCSRGLLVSMILRRWVIVSRHMEKTKCPHLHGSMRPRNLGSDYPLALHRIPERNSIIYLWNFTSRCTSMLRIGKFFYFFFSVLVIWVCISAPFSSCGPPIFGFH